MMGFSAFFCKTMSIIDHLWVFNLDSDMDNGRDFKTVASWIKFGLLWLKDPVFHNSSAGSGIYLVAMEWMCWRGFKLDWYKSCAVGFVNRSWANLDNCQTFMKLPEPLVPGGDIAQLRIKSGSREEELRGKSQKIKNHRKGAEKKTKKNKII